MKKTSIRSILAANLRNAMDAHQTLNTQMRLALRSGIAQRTVGRMLSGAVDPQLGHVEAVAEALGVSVTDLLTDHGGEPALRFDRERVAKLSAEDRAKIQTFIEFIIASQDVGSGASDAPFSISETIPATPAQRDMVKRVAQRRPTINTLSIDENQTRPKGGSRGRR
ncbi:helix-turn-helix transcriptional regulator [Paraburkholderia agricolaris]|uniref:Helix-turn-helix transcriptional regulator n=1 Tax=Paraburkholderia agricolaris TaxID=2152888 RepID=A0ABW8ZIR0_9BURK